jgi:hypothetical protein
LEERYFVTVQYVGRVSASYAAESLWRRERFSEAWMAQLYQHYEVARVSDHATMFVVRRGSRP